MFLSGDTVSLRTDVREEVIQLLHTRHKHSDLHKIISSSPESIFSSINETENKQLGLHSTDDFFFLYP